MEEEENPVPLRESMNIKREKMEEKVGIQDIRF